MSVDFVDSNVLVYAVDQAAGAKQQVAQQIIADGLVSGTLIISFQVVQEVLSTIRRKFAQPVAAVDAELFLARVLEPMWRVMPSPTLYRRALELQARSGYAFYDALIVAAALDAGCDRLLSEDMHDGHQVEGLVIENPFGV